jgi:hypothetical protein
MPKMTHWNSPDTIDATPEKAAVYAAQGWQVVDGDTPSPAKAPVVTAMTTDAVDEPAEPVKKVAAKKAPAKKAAKKS